jgi:predicted nucleic acid-binding protein
MARKLWVLLAVGALTYQIEHHRLALEELRAESEITGALPGALASIEAEAHAAERRRAALRDLLPHDTPEHWVAVGGAAIFDEYERKVREVGRRLNPSVRDTDVQPLRRRLEAICVAGSPSFNPEDTPSFTRDRKDDPIVYTALLGHADYLISDDHDIVLDGSEHVYEHDEHRVLAVTFNRFVTTYFEPADLDWSAIDGRWLRRAFEGDTAPP